MIKIDGVKVWVGRKGDVHVQVDGRDERGNRVVGNCTAVSPLQVQSATEEIIQKMQKVNGSASIDYADPLPY